MNTEQIINTYFQSEKLADNYLSARLAGNIDNAPPCVSSYQSEEHLADVLFSIYYQDIFTQEQKTWFWNALNEQAKTAWNNKNSDIFGRAIYLYMRLGKDEANNFDWSNFIDADVIKWHELMDDNDINLYSSALWLLADWSRLAIDWNSQFDAIVNLLRKNEKLIRPLNNVFNTIDFLDYKQWRQLFLECDSSENLRELLQQYLLTYWGLYNKNPACEPLLIDYIQKAVIEAKAISNKGLSKQEVKIVNDWLKLPWTIKPKDKIEKLSKALKHKPSSPWQNLALAA